MIKYYWRVATLKPSWLLRKSSTAARLDASSVAVAGSLQWTLAPCAVATSAMLCPSVDTQTESNSETKGRHNQPARMLRGVQELETVQEMGVLPSCYHCFTTTCLEEYSYKMSYSLPHSCIVLKVLFSRLSFPRRARFLSLIPLLPARASTRAVTSPPHFRSITLQLFSLWLDFCKARRAETALMTSKCVSFIVKNSVIQIKFIDCLVRARMTTVRRHRWQIEVFSKAEKVYTMRYKHTYGHISVVNSLIPSTWLSGYLILREKKGVK